MSGWVNIACRLTDGAIHVATAHSRNAHDLYGSDLTFLAGDDSGAKSYLDQLKNLGTDVSNKPLTEHEYGVLAVDFIQKTILFNRNDWDIRKARYFDWHSPHDKEMAAAGRVKLVSPDGSTPCIQILPNLEPLWEYLVDYPEPREPDNFDSLPFPIRYYLRKPTPFFEYDYSPWTIQQFDENDQEAFMVSLETHGFTVDRPGWLSKFEDAEDGF